ncbi:MAG: hypothetical protein AAFW98_09630 [Pseudomonadota bacterium]
MPDPDKKPLAGSSFAFAFIGAFAGTLAALSIALLAFQSGLIAARAPSSVDGELIEVAAGAIALPTAQVGQEYKRWACAILSSHSPDEPLDCAKVENQQTQDVDASETAKLEEPTGLALTPWKTDIELYQCRPNVTVLLVAHRIGEQLARHNYGSFGYLEWSRTNEIPLSALIGTTTIVVDEGHPETIDAERVARIIATIGDVPPARIIENGADETPWRLSVIVCPNQNGQGGRAPG